MEKSQAVRLIDVFLLGPFMIWAGTRLDDPLTRALLVAAGGATIGYNWANYEAHKNTALAITASNRDRPAK